MSLSAVIEELGDLLLEQVEGRRFVLCGPEPAWCKALRLGLESGQPFLLDEPFPFLEVFLPEAEDCWRKVSGCRVESDFWTEIDKAGDALHLEAIAVLAGARHLLVIRRNERLFNQQQLVLQRARELRLMHARLVREIEQKDVLAHCIVHDLSAPLHGILGSLSLLSELPLSADGRKWTMLALQAATRQRELIRDILEVFAAEYDPPTDASDTLTVADVTGAIAHVAAEAEAVARTRDAEIRTVYDAGPWRVVAEEMRLVRALANLVQNALRHSPPGGKVTISVTSLNQDVRVSVDDDGPGVPLEVLPYLFERFAGGRKEPDGTGLGLYFCRITVERWGGGIGYERRPGGGSRFWLRLVSASDRRQDGEPALSGR